MNPKKALLLRRQRTVEALPPFEDLIRGSLVERRLRCGKPGCHCAQGETHRAYYLTVSFARGRVEQVTIPEELLPVVRRWIDNYHRWWQGLEDVSAINRELLRERWIDEGRHKRGGK